MKKIIPGLIVMVLGCLCVISCRREEIPTYSTSNDIYFSVLKNSIPQDTTIVTFAYSPVTKDTTITLLIRVSGPAVAQDRPFKLLVLDTAGSKATPGEHYEFMKPMVIPANALSLTMPVKFYKTTAMATRSFSVEMQLQPNEYFTTSLQYAVIDQAQNTTKNILHHTITVDDRLAKPSGWVDLYFGNFTKKKILLMSEAVPYKLADFNTANNGYLPISTATFLSSFMLRYFKDHAAVGDTIREEDGSIMTMGPNASM